jgi:hypothetical protein
LVKGSDFSALTPQILAKLLTITLRWPLLIVDATAHPTLLERLETIALRKIQPSNPLERFWIAKMSLKQLLLIGSSDVNGMSPTYSLFGLDLERYLRVSPAITRRQEVRSQATSSYESVSQGNEIRSRETDASGSSPPLA